MTIKSDNTKQKDTYRGVAKQLLGRTVRLSGISSLPLSQNPQWEKMLKWAAIVQASKSNPALADALHKAEMIYALTKEQR